MTVSRMDILSIRLTLMRIIMPSINDHDSVELLDDRNALQIIDQTKLPGNIEIIRLKTAREIWDAIYQLKVRGAPAIGVTAAMGIYILMKGFVSSRMHAEDFAGENAKAFRETFEKYAEYLNSSRPTAVNLSWALRRMERALDSCTRDGNRTVADVLDRLRAEACAIRDEDVEVCRKIGEYGLTLLKPGDGILTHCNAGQLATIRYGTATAPIYLGQERGYNFRVFCDETRPLLQGARLTAFELMSAGVDCTLECDNMCASLMKSGQIQAILVGCDRVAANGDAANKIGTSVVAIVAARYGIPFYVCAPTSTIDISVPTGDGIVIEQRKAEEVTKMWYSSPMAPSGVKVYNPAFDVTDHDLISGIITEYGILREPYETSIAALFETVAGGCGS